MRIRYIPVIGLIVVISGCLALTAWQFDISQLKSIIPGVTAMNPLTAATFILCGIWLLLFRQNTISVIMHLICGIITIVGLVHFVTYFYPADIRMDNLLYGNKIAVSGVQNMIAPNTAFLFVVSGICMFTTASRREWIQVVRQALLMLGMLLVYVSLLGYLYGMQPAYRFGGLTPMALFTALVFAALLSGLFYCNLQYGVPKFFVSSLNGSRLLRRVFIFLLLVPPLIGYLRLEGEQRGLYPTEFGVELYTLTFSLVVLGFMILYASRENNNQIQKIKAEMQLAASETKFRTVFNSLKEGVACLDFSGRVLYCNPSYCSILGFKEEELLGQVIFELLTPSSMHHLYRKKLEDRKEGTNEDYQAEVLRKNGRRYG